MHRMKGFTLIELMIVIAIIAIIAAIAIPGLLQAQRASNERNASASLKTMATAEADFRANDRDNNRAQDYWTHDVSGLYTLTPYGLSGAPATAARIKLIDISIASADTDAAQAFATASASSWGTTSVTLIQPSSAKAAYWYFAMDQDLGTGVSADYRQADTIATANTSHKNTSIFGFGAYPDSMGSGRNMFIVNENNTVFRRPVISNTVRGSAAVPPGIAGPAQAGVFPGTAVDPRDWPSDPQFAQGGYSKTD